MTLLCHFNKLERHKWHWQPHRGCECVCGGCVFAGWVDGWRIRVTEACPSISKLSARCGNVLSGEFPSFSLCHLQVFLASASFELSPWRWDKFLLVVSAVRTSWHTHAHSYSYTPLISIIIPICNKANWRAACQRAEVERATVEGGNCHKRERTIRNCEFTDGWGATKRGKAREESGAKHAISIKWNA